MLIDIIDHLPPQTIAMLQALYSRSPKSIRERMAELVTPEQVDSFINLYFIGYGHRSIGDCGSTTAFIEGVSMLTAKAIQDNPLYSGQEASTRYMDFSNVTFDDPLNMGKYQKKCMAFYHEHMPAVIEHVHKQYHPTEGENLVVYGRAVKARAFDIMRGFIPAGAHTNLSWHSNLRQLQDRLEWLQAHPDEHVQVAAASTEGQLAEKYSSFAGETRGKSEWERALFHERYYFPQLHAHGTSLEVRPVSQIEYQYPALLTRPARAAVPHWYASEVRVITRMRLDFGSFRDLQRHRNATIRMPMLTTHLGFNTWYLASLPPSVLKAAEILLDEITAEFQSYHSFNNRIAQQNYIPMGFNVYTEVEQSIGAWLYRVELRSSPTVHPTLRQVILEEIEQMRRLVPELAIHANMSPDPWDVRRGTQTITTRGSDND